MRKNLFNNLGLECSNTEHGDHCGCALCIPAAAEPLPENTPLPADASLITDIVEADFDYQTAEEASLKLESTAVALEKLCLAIETSQAANYHVTPSDGAMLHLSVTVIEKRMGIRTRTLPALECFTSDSELAMQLSLEGLGDFLIRVWEAIKRTVIQLYNSILGFLKKLLGYTNVMERQAARNKKDINDLKRGPLGPLLLDAPIKLSAAAISALWDVDAKSVSTNLSKDIESYRNMFINGFLPFVDNQMVSDQATRNILDSVVRRAHSDLDRGRKKDEKIAKDLMAFADKKLQEAMGVLTTQRVCIVAPLNGKYLGGLVVDSKADQNYFDWASFTPAHDVVLPAVSLEELSAINDVGTNLSIAYSQFIGYTYDKLEDALHETTEKLSAEIEELSNNYGDFPKLLQAFQVALHDNKRETNKLISNVYRVSSNTSKLCAAIHGEVIPALIGKITPQ